MADLKQYYQHNLIDTIKYTFFSSFHGTSTEIDQIPRYKSHLNKVKEIGTTQSIFLDLMKLN